MQTSYNGTDPRFLMAFGLAFLAAGLGIGAFYYGLLDQWYETRSWVEVPCVIESTELREHLDREEDSSSGEITETLLHEVVAEYSYEYQGVSHKGSEVSITGGSDNFGDYQERTARILKEHRESGEPYRCFVNPKQPSEAVIFRDARWTILLFISTFPVIFPLVGGLTSAFAWRKLRAARQTKKLEEKYPEQPWRWKPAWGLDWMPPKDKTHAWAWVSVALWMACVWLPMVYALVVDSDMRRSNPLSLMGFLPLPLIALAGVIALYRVLQQPQRGMLLHVDPRPVVPGETMHGHLAIPRGVVSSIRGEVQVELRCVKETAVDLGKQVLKGYKAVWSHEVTVPMSDATREAKGSRVPFSLDVPEDLSAQSADLAEIGWEDTTQHLWELEVRARGLRRRTVFDVPVFQLEPRQKKRSAKKSSGKQAIHPLKLDGDELTLHLAKYHITAVFNKNDMPVSLELSPKRYGLVKLFLVCFTLVWSLVFIILLNADVAGLFPIIWGGSSAVLWGLVMMMMRQQRLVFTDDRVEASWSLGMWGGKKLYERRDLVQFSERVNMTSGSTAYYVVSAETTFGKKVPLVDGIPSQLVVENLSRLLERWRKQA